MSTFEELLAVQIQTIRSISRVLPNFKKLGQTRMTRAVTRERLTQLKEIFGECRDVHAKLSRTAKTKAETEHAYFTEDRFLDCEDVYNETSDYLAEILAAFETPDVKQAAASDISGSSDSFRTSTHLPKLHLPSFDGSIEKWENFRDRFLSLINNDQSLSNVDRMHYLYSCIKGDASNALSHLAITDANFKVAWDILLSRYDNKRRLINCHLQSLLALPVAAAKTSKDLCTLRDQTNSAIQALKNLGRPVEHWDDIVVFLVAQKLDKTSREAWELKLGASVAYPTFDELCQFLNSRIRALEAILPSPAQEKPQNLPKTAKNNTFASHAASTVNFSCPVCKGHHLLYQCSTFANQTPSQRSEVIRKHKRCLNCFSAKHIVKECPSSRSCKQCHKRHHTMLHFDSTTMPSHAEQPVAATTLTEKPETDVATHLLSDTVAPKIAVLLATARVRIHSPQGRFVTVRALIDQGSVATLITESLAQCLKLPKIKRAVCVTGIGETQSVVRHAAKVIVTPASRDGPAYSTNALVLKALTKYTPHQFLSNGHWKHISGLHLADSEPMSSDPIDIIIGADLYGMLLLDGVRKGAANEPVAQSTTLGWILSGPVSSSSTDLPTSVHSMHGAIPDDIDSTLRRFWEVEEIPQKAHLSPEEIQCEEHFLSTHSRTSHGRYVVRLPFKSGPPIDIGDSRSAALASLERLERRLLRQPTVALEYREFLDEYHELGHMAKTQSADSRISYSQRYYIPHHAVFRDGSKTTHLRVVFNASCSTTNGTSLNDHLLIGPKLQTDLATVLLQWRQHRYVYTADIAKMYRQIAIDPRDTDFQRILWRSSSDEPVDEYKLLTVTYGTASAPYLALRVLRQLMHDEGPRYPLAVPVVMSKLYVDDCLFGADDKVLARQTRDQLIALLDKGGFRLRKWASNCDELLADIDPSDHGLAGHKILEEDTHLKILGIAWNPRQDVFQFNVSVISNPGNTKRAVLSTIAKFFDPLGWAAPVIISAKILMQKLWLLQCQWDDEIPEEYSELWQQYCKRLPCLGSFKVPRWTEHGSHALQGALHGFCDASTKAYAAAVYLRTVSVDGFATVSLLIAKSKVAPLKTISIPRLELSAAHLLARLMRFAQTALHFHHVECMCWTDSTIALAWIMQPPSRWRTFVANRVSAIQSLLPNASWHHIPTQDNPADCASRGLAPDEIARHPLWLTGPPWLTDPPETWPPLKLPSPSLPSGSVPEERVQTHVYTTLISDGWDLASRFSSWPKLLRVTAYINRFVTATRKPAKLHTNQKTDTCQSVILDANEIHTAKNHWIRTMQSELFPTEISNLSSRLPLPKSSALSALNPYLDSDGILRVGGRLRHSDLPEAIKHPIVLKSHPLLSLLIWQHHLVTMHGGPQLTLTSLRNEFWILRARTTIRAVLHKCVRCAREAAKVATELMGDLPHMRVTRTSRAFLHTGVDYAGPIAVRRAPGRCHKTHKAYIALFICLTTKAIHLELVSDYTSATFIAAYHRFISRRGLPQNMYSDNGTTFKGADREMSDAYFKAIRDNNFLNQLVSDNTSWHFMPPAAPHFGGLWEAGVRSVKYHLKRCIGLHTLTYEELTTVLCRIEACLNSRPIAASSENIDDYKALTPGHFLIGTPLLSLPEPSVLDLNEHRLSRWQIVQRITEGFWKSWQNDYLHTLQQRTKWRIAQRLARVGQIVLLRNPLTPPSQWELGRICKCHPGDDGLTRVVTVQTGRSKYKRPLAKICFLPVDINEEMTTDSVKAGGTQQ